jgi:hypothetical protein
MNATTRLRAIGKVTGVAATTAPVVRRLATDDELRADMSDFVASANHLVRELARDERLRRDLRHIFETAQSSAGHLREDVRPRRGGRVLFVLGAGMVLGVLVIGGALLYPRTRESVVRAADQTVKRASASVHDIRARITRSSGASSESEAPAETVEQAA